MASPESRVEVLERKIAELRAELAEARRDTARAHELLALARPRGATRAPDADPPPPRV